MKKKFTFFKKAISAMTAFALVATMTPSIAFADTSSTENETSTEATEVIETSDSNSAEDESSETPSATPEASEGSDTDANEASGSSASTDTDGSTADADEPSTDVSTPNIINEKVNIKDGSAPATSDDIDVLNADVDIQREATTIVSYNGLNFKVNSEDPETVTLVGWGANAPSGDITIPATISTQSKTLTVTGIDLLGAEDEALTKDALLASDTVASTFSAPKVTGISVPSTVTFIEKASFAAFPNLEFVEVSDDNKIYSDFNGMLFSEDTSNLLLVPEGLGVTLLGLAQTCWDLQIPCSE